MRSAATGDAAVAGFSGAAGAVAAVAGFALVRPAGIMVAGAAAIASAAARSRMTAGLHGMSRAEIVSRYDEIIGFAELEGFEDTPYKHLSNGMKVRLAFAVVSQLDEPTLLVDEVLAVGDKAFREKCYRRIDELLAEGRTLFFVSHNEKDLRRFCTRGLYLDTGALKLAAPIADVLDAYTADYAPR